MSKIVMFGQSSRLVALYTAGKCLDSANNSVIVTDPCDVEIEDMIRRESWTRKQRQETLNLGHAIGISSHVWSRLRMWETDLLDSASLSFSRSLLIMPLAPSSLLMLVIEFEFLITLLDV